jgi:hypothetical protein
MGAPSKRRLLRDAVLSGACTLALLGACELAARLFVSADPTIRYRIEREAGRARSVALYRFDSLLGWALQPNAAAPFDAPDFHSFVHVDARGQRAIPIEPPAQPARRVLVLGDSVAFGVGVDDGDTFAALLAAGHRELAVEALGVPGYGTDQELLSLERELAARKIVEPTTAVITFYPNDLLDITRSAARINRRPHFLLASDGQLALIGPPLPPPERGPDMREGMNGTLADRFRLYSLLRPRIENLLASLGAMEREMAIDDQLGFFVRRYARDREPKWTLWRAIMDRALATTRAAGVDLLVLVVPVRPQADGAVLGSLADRWGYSAADFDLDEPSREIGAWGRARGVPIADALASSRAARQRGAPIYFAFDDHPTREGHRLLADVLTPFVAASHAQSQ